MNEDRSSTVDDIVHRSAVRAPERVALIFAGRTWTYRALDDAASRAAAYLLALGLSRGDRVATVGANSDAYLLAFLGCSRAGLVHVPVNYALTGRELAYILSQSGSRIALVDSELFASVSAVRGDTCLEQILVLHGAIDAVLPQWSSGAVPPVRSEVLDTDLVQLLYTSGTTSNPKGAMMTHRALVHEYVLQHPGPGCLRGRRPAALHAALPLRQGMHVFLMPYLAVGATNRLMARPDVPEILRRIGSDRIGALFLAPTVWVPLANHPDLAGSDLASLRKAFYGASIMPVPVLQRLQAMLPELGFYNCFGQSEIGPTGHRAQTGRARGAA